MKKNGISSNIIYALRNIWKWDKAYYLYFISSIPFAIILPLAGIYFQKLIIDLVQNSESVSYIICVIGLYFILLFFVDLITRFCSSRLGMRKYNFSTLYQMEISEKFMRTDYSNTDNPNINILYSHAMNDACSGQCAPEFILESLLSF